MILARTLAALAATTLTTLTALTAPAHAESTRLVDRADQAPAYLDLVSAQIDNGARRLEATIRLARFDADRTSAYAVVEAAGTRGRDLYVVGWSAVRGERQGRVFGRVAEDGFELLGCRGLRVGHGRETLSVSLPQRCLGRTAGRLRVSVLSEGRGGGDVDDLGPRRLRRG